MCATYSTGNNTADPIDGTTTFTAKTADGDSDSDVNASWVSASRATSMATISQSISKPIVSRTTNISQLGQDISHPTVPRAKTQRVINPETGRPMYNRSSLFVVDPIEALVVPGSFFEAADGKVVDQNGDRIEEAEWLIARGSFSSATKVNNGYFTIQLLRVTYDEFLLTADSGKDDVDYVWFQSTDVRAEPGDRNNLVIEFERAEISGSTGFEIGLGIN
jgi:hypothetical protein